MNVGLDAFSDELMTLTKEAKGVARRVAELVAKKPLHALGFVSVLGPTAAGAITGYKRGKILGREPRYLKASKHGPSPALYGNFHRTLGRKKLRDDQIRRLHEHHRPSKLKRKS